LRSNGGASKSSGRDPPKPPGRGTLGRGPPNPPPGRWPPKPPPGRGPLGRGPPKPPPNPPLGRWPPGRGPPERWPNDFGPSNAGPSGRGPSNRGPSGRGPSGRGPSCRKPSGRGFLPPAFRPPAWSSPGLCRWSGKLIRSLSAHQLGARLSRLVGAAPALAVARVFHKDPALGEHGPQAVGSRPVAGGSGRGPLVYELLQLRVEQLFRGRDDPQDAV